MPAGGFIRTLFLFGCLLVLAGLEALHEAINLAGRVDDTLLTGVKRVAFGANVKTQCFFGRNRRPCAATTGARVDRLVRFGVDTLLHRMLLISRPRRRRH